MISTWDGVGYSFKDLEDTSGLVSEGSGIRHTGVKIPEAITWKYWWVGVGMEQGGRKM